MIKNIWKFYSSIWENGKLCHSVFQVHYYTFNSEERMELSQGKDWDYLTAHWKNANYIPSITALFKLTLNGLLLHKLHHSLNISSDLYIHCPETSHRLLHTQSTNISSTATHTVRKHLIGFSTHSPQTSHQPLHIQSPNISSASPHTVPKNLIRLSTQSLNISSTSLQT